MSDVPKTITCHDIDGNEIEVKVSDMTFRPSVYGIIIHEGKILLSRFKNGYDFPGGGIDIGESIPNALKREVREETGVSVEVGQLIHVQEDFFVHPVTKKSHHCILMLYTCHSPKGEITTDMFDTSDLALGTLKAEWLPIEDALKAKFFNPFDSEALIRKVRATSAKS